MAAVLLLIGGYVFITEQNLREHQGANELFGVSGKEPLEKVQFYYHNEKYAIEKKGNSWQMSDLQGTPLNNENLKEVLNSISKLKSYNIVTPDADRKDEVTLFGLDKPELVLDLSFGGKKKTIEFGRKHSFSGRRYAQIVGEERVFLIDDKNYQGLLKEKSQLRNDKPLSFDPREIVEIEAEREGLLPKRLRIRTIEDRLSEDLSEHEIAHWEVFDDEKKFLAEGSLLAKELEELNNITAKSVIEMKNGEEEDFGLKEPKLTLYLKHKKDNVPSITVLIGKVSTETTSRYFLKVKESSWVYELKTMPASDFLEPADYFRDRTPFNDLKIASLHKISIIKKKPVEAEFSFTNSNGIWILRSGKNEEGDILAVDQLLIKEWVQKLLDFKVISFEPEGTQENRERVIEIRMSFSNPNLSYQVTFGEELQETGSGLEIKTEKQISMTAPPKEPLLPDELTGAGAPRFAWIQEDGKPALPVFVSASSWSEFDRQPNDFVIKEKGQASGQ